MRKEDLKKFILETIEIAMRHGGSGDWNRVHPEQGTIHWNWIDNYYKNDYEGQFNRLYELIREQDKKFETICEYLNIDIRDTYAVKKERK